MPLSANPTRHTVVSYRIVSYQLPCTTDVMDGGARLDSMEFCLSLLQTRGVAVSGTSTRNHEHTAIHTYEMDRYGPYMS